jgi:putative acetyltransferase
MAVVIRAEEPGDRKAVYAVNSAAFETDAEADLVEALREQARPLVSLLAEMSGAGIGSKLVAIGLERCRQLGIKAVIVQGHPDYYPRFGFQPASCFGIESEYEVPDEVFMVMELEADALNGVNGRVSYHEAFKNI